MTFKEIRQSIDQAFEGREGIKKRIRELFPKIEDLDNYLENNGINNLASSLLQSYNNIPGVNFKNFCQTVKNIIREIKDEEQGCKKGAIKGAQEFWEKEDKRGNVTEWQ